MAQPTSVYFRRFFDATPRVYYAYAFSTIRDKDSYRTWFHSPTNPAYDSSSTECIYTASAPATKAGATALSHQAWVVRTDGDPETYPYSADDGGRPSRFKPVVNHPSLQFVGDPAVVKIGDLYYMLYSAHFPHPSADRLLPLGHVYGGISRDGISWEGKKWMWHGHRPSILLDGDQLRCWYDKADFIAYHRAMPIERLAEFWDTTASGPWSVETLCTNLGHHNIDVAKVAGTYFAVHDGVHDNRVAVLCSESIDGLTFTESRVLATLSDIPPSELDGNWSGLDIPQLLNDAGRHYLVATAKSLRGNPPRGIPRRSFLFALDFGESGICGPVDFHESGIPGFNTLPVVRRYDVTRREATVELRRGKTAEPHSYGGLQVFSPSQKNFAVSFDFTTNFSNEDVYAAVTVPGTARLQTFDWWGEHNGKIGIDLAREGSDGVPWVGFGLFSKRRFTVQHDNWLFRVRNLRLYY